MGQQFSVALAQFNQDQLDTITGNVAIVQAAVDAIKNTDLSAVAANVVTIKDTTIPAVKTVVDNIHTTDLPAVATNVTNIRNADLPAVSAKVSKLAENGQKPTPTTAGSSYSNTLLNISGAGVLLGLSANTQNCITLDGGTVIYVAVGTVAYASLNYRFNSSCVILSSAVGSASNAAIYRLD